MRTNQSSLVRPNNCSLKSPLCAAVCTQAARIFPPFCTLQMRTPHACDDGTERTGAKYSLIDRGYLLCFTAVCHYIKGMFSYLISTRSKAVFYKPSLTHKRHLSHPYPLLCSVQSALYPAQRPLSSFNERSIGEASCLGSTAIYWIYRLGETKKVTKISSNDKHRNRLVGKKTSTLF